MIRRRKIILPHPLPRNGETVRIVTKVTVGEEECLTPFSLEELILRLDPFLGGDHRYFDMWQ